MSLAENIKRISEEKNISMYRIAKNGELSMSYVWELVKGKKTNPSIDVVRKLAKGLDTTIESLVN